MLIHTIITKKKNTNKRNQWKKSKVKITKKPNLDLIQFKFRFNMLVLINSFIYQINNLK